MRENGEGLACKNFSYYSSLYPSLCMENRIYSVTAGRLPRLTRLLEQIAEIPLEFLIQRKWISMHMDHIRILALEIWILRGWDTQSSLQGAAWSEDYVFNKDLQITVKLIYWCSIYSLMLLFQIIRMKNEILSSVCWWNSPYSYERIDALKDSLINITLQTHQVSHWTRVLFPSLQGTGTWHVW